MSLLNFDSHGLSPKGEKKSLGIFLGIGALVATIALGSTLAASINLNDNGPVEFGQGIAQTVACSGDENLTITPNATFVNSSGGGTFQFSSVKVSDIPSSCNGKDFTIRAYGDSSNIPLALFDDDATSVVAYNDGESFKLLTGLNGLTINSGTGTFTVNFTTPVALSTSVFSITIESSAHAYSVGDTGPAGGKIFYYSEAGFSCGPDRSSTCNFLEAAPSLWNGGGSDPSRRWANETYELTEVNNASSPQTASATAIGWGYRNTRAIILQGNTDPATSAAALADSHSVTVSGVTYSDWFLPSNNELTQLYNNIEIVEGLFQGFDWYWSSSEASGGSALMQMMGSFNAGGDDKTSARLVRPIRAF
jgi:hypothetical protein